MNASALISDARQRGIRLGVSGDRLRVEAPVGTLTPELRAALAQHKTQIIDALSATTHGDTGKFIDWNQLPDPATATEALGQKDMDDIKAGHAVPVWLGIVQEWAWWVRGEVERQKLLSEGCKLPIYTLGELAVIVNMSDQAVKNMHALKRDMGAVIRPAGQDGKRKN